MTLDTRLPVIFQDKPSKLVPECLHCGFIGAKDDTGGGDK